METITDILKSGIDITVSMSSKDLREFARIVREEAQADSIEGCRDSESYYTPEEVQNLLKVSTATLWRWNKKGFLQHITLYGLRRYRKSDVDRLTNNTDEN